MGLLIKPNGAKKIYYNGTDVEIPQVYKRLEFSAEKTGTKISVGSYDYISKEKYAQEQSENQPLKNYRLKSDLPSKSVFILNEGESQSILVAHQKLRDFYVDLGYNVTIEL